LAFLNLVSFGKASGLKKPDSWMPLGYIGIITPHLITIKPYHAGGAAQLNNPRLIVFQTPSSVSLNCHAGYLKLKGERIHPFGPALLLEKCSLRRIHDFISGLLCPPKWGSTHHAASVPPGDGSSE